MDDNSKRTSEITKRIWQWFSKRHEPLLTKVTALSIPTLKQEFLRKIPITTNPSFVKYHCLHSVLSHKEHRVFFKCFIMEAFLLRH